MFERFISWLRAAAIERIEQDINWANASHDAHVAGLELKLAQLRAQDRRSTEQVVRDISRREKGFA